MRIHRSILTGLVGLVLAVPSTASAQVQAAGLAFAGCWAPADGLSSRDLICMTPTAAAMLQFTSITADGKVTESTLSLDGRRVPVQGDACTGWEEGRLTADRERLLVNAEIKCGTAPNQVRSTAFTITKAGYLLQATGSGFAQVANTQVRVYAPVESYADIPPATREELMPYLVGAERERLAVRSNAVSAKDLVEFEQLGVAPALIDLLVAASYPDNFVIDGVGAVSSAPTLDAGGRRPAYVANPFGFMNGYPMLSMYDWQQMYQCAQFGIGCYGMSMFGYNPYYGYGYGAYGYGYGGYGGYYPGYGIPVVVRPVTTPSPTGGTTGGRAVRGRGYTQSGSGSTGGGTAAPRSTTGNSSGASVQGSGGSGGSSSGGSGGASSSGSGARTAKPRP